MAYEKVACPECGEEYKSLGGHWGGSPSHRPELTNYQREIITGLMMGDGSLWRRGKNPRLRVRMITKEYLEELDEIFGCLSTGVGLFKTAEENAKEHRESDFQPNAKVENYHDVWKWKTRSLPELHEFDWYTGKDEEKVWPEDIELTPTVLTHWYVSDGSWRNKESSNYIYISTVKEIENTDKIDSYFEKGNLPTPSRYDKSSFSFTVEDSHTLWEYMDEPPSGFEYKFPLKYLPFGEASDEYDIPHSPDPTITIEVSDVNWDDSRQLTMKKSELKRIVEDLDL